MNVLKSVGRWRKNYKRLETGRFPTNFDPIMRGENPYYGLRGGKYDVKACVFKVHNKLAMVPS